MIVIVICDYYKDWGENRKVNDSNETGINRQELNDKAREILVFFYKILFSRILNVFLI